MSSPGSTDAEEPVDCAMLHPLKGEPLSLFTTLMLSNAASKK